MTNRLLPETICIKRFKPAEIIKFDPDAPITYNPAPPTEMLSNTDDVIRMTQQLYDAEYKAWEGEHSNEILETIIDGGVRDIAEVCNFLARIGTVEAFEQRRKLVDLAIQWKKPRIGCLLKCLEQIFVNCSEDEVLDAISRLTKDKGGGNGEAGGQ